MIHARGMQASKKLTLQVDRALSISSYIFSTGAQFKKFLSWF